MKSSNNKLKCIFEWWGASTLNCGTYTDSIGLKNSGLKNFRLSVNSDIQFTNQDVCFDGKCQREVPLYSGKAYEGLWLFGYIRFTDSQAMALCLSTDRLSVQRTPQKRWADLGVILNTVLSTSRMAIFSLENLFRQKSPFTFVHTDRHTHTHAATLSSFLESLCCACSFS